MNQQLIPLQALFSRQTLFYACLVSSSSLYSVEKYLVTILYVTGDLGHIRKERFSMRVPEREEMNTS